MEVQRKFHSEYGRNRKAPDSRSLRRWHDMLLTTGSVTPQNVQRKRSLSSRNDENMERVEQHFEEDPHTSIRRAAHVLDMSRSTVQRILHGLKGHPYKVQIVQRLYEEEPSGIRARGAAANPR